MYMFLSFVVAFISLYCLGTAVNAHNTDTTNFMPLATLLIYSLFSIVRELKKDDDSFQTYDSYRNSSHIANNVSTRSYTPNSYRTQNNINRQIVNEKVEYFTQTQKEKKNVEALLIHYPSNQEVRDKIKELEKKRWFRIKKKIANFFGHDITKKYYDEFKKPYKINKKGKVIAFSAAKENKEDPNRFMPQLDYEKKEYNDVTKLMGRSFEISLIDEQSQNVCE